MEAWAPQVRQMSLFSFHDKPNVLWSHAKLVCLHTDSADNEVNEEQKKEKIAELKNKQKDLEDLLIQKLDELKKVCLREAVSGFVTLHRLFKWYKK